MRKSLSFLSLFVMLMPNVYASDNNVPMITVKAKPVNPAVVKVEPSKVKSIKRVTSITDILQNQKGVIVQNSQFGKKVFIKGLNDEKYRIMINGIPVANRGTYHARAFEWDTIPYEGLKSVKLIEGPFSAEYGYQSGGAVDLIMQKPSRGLHGKVSVEAGKFKEHQENLLLNAGTKNLGLIASGRFLETHTQLDRQYIRNYNYSLMPSMNFSNIKLNGLMFHNFRKERYPFDRDMKFNMYEKWKYEPGSYFTYSNDGYDLNANVNPFNLSIFYNEQERKDYPETYYVKKKGGYKRLPYELEYNMDHTNVYFPGLKLKWNGELPVGGNLKLGFEFRRPKTRTHFSTPFYKNKVVWLNEYIRVHNNMYALFGEYKRPISKRVSSTTGMRFDWYNVFGASNRFLPSKKTEKFGFNSDKHHLDLSETLSFEPIESLSTYVSAGTIFTPPKIMDYFRWFSNYMPSARAKSVIKSTPSLSRFVKNGKVNVKSWQEALGKLKPETGYGLEVGTKYHKEGLNLNLKGFCTYINDYVGKYPTWHAPTYNIDNVKLYGAVLEGRKLLMRNVSFRGLLTYENTHKSGDRLLIDSKRLPNIPKWKLDGYLRIKPYRNVNITPSVHYVGKRPTGGAPLQTIDTLGGYTTYNVALNYSCKTLRFDFLAQNIFDRKAYERIDSPVLERCFTFRMTKEF